MKELPPTCSLNASVPVWPKQHNIIVCLLHVAVLRTHKSHHFILATTCRHITNNIPPPDTSTTTYNNNINMTLKIATSLV